MILFPELFDEYELAKFIYEDIKECILTNKDISYGAKSFKIEKTMYYYNKNYKTYNKYMSICEKMNGFQINHIKKMSKEDNKINIILYKVKCKFFATIQYNYSYNHSYIIQAKFHIKPNFKCDNCQKSITNTDYHHPALYFHECILPYRIVKKYYDIILT